MLVTILVIVAVALLGLISIGLALAGRANALFLSMVALTLLLVGVAVARDTQQRDYLAIQDQYKQDYPNDTPAFDVKLQQLFPAFVGAKRGDSFRVERCISCHVPNLQTIGPQTAAQRIACDFFKYEPNATALKKAYGLQSAAGANGSCMTAHPLGISAQATVGYENYQQYGPSARATDKNGKPLTATTNGVTEGVPGFLPTNVDPNNPANPGSNPGDPSQSKMGLDAVGCVVCHNGNRLGITEADAHQNLIVNPEYSWSQGAQLYYQYCVSCHGGNGEGGKGPPLNNQDRLGYFNEDYYYRCIEYGLTDFEHYGTIMPNWGSIASDYVPSEHPPGPGGAVNQKRILTEDQINLLIQFVRHWQQYDSLP